MKLISLLLFTCIAFSQTISGIVFDENKLAMPGVSVYLDGTSIGTVTNDDGTFELSVQSRINTSLVFSFIGYESVYVSDPFGKSKYEVHLKPKTSMLREVVIANDHFSRTSKLKAFREQFLGRTKGGRSSRILNEDDINFLYDFKTNTLKAFSDKPLKIENPHLGYTVDFNLVEFFVRFTRKSVNSADAYASAYAGTTVFREMNGDKHEFSKRRLHSFKGSQMEFFRNLVDGKWGKDDFQLYKGSFPASPDDCFSIVQNNDTYELTIKGDDIETKGLSLHEPKFYAAFNLLYNKKDQSRVTFGIEKLSIDGFGNIDAPLDVIFSGKMSESRVGDMLPMDYSP